MRNLEIESLITCSCVSLQDLYLVRLNEAANLRKKLIDLEDAARQAEAEALLAHWLLEYHKRLSGVKSPPVQRAFEFPAALPGAQKVTKQSYRRVKEECA